MDVAQLFWVNHVKPLWCLCAYFSSLQFLPFIHFISRSDCLQTSLIWYWVTTPSQQKGYNYNYLGFSYKLVKLMKGKKTLVHEFLFSECTYGGCSSAQVHQSTCNQEKENLILTKVEIASFVYFWH